MFPNIEAERGRTKTSQEQLAIVLGVSPRTIRNWLAGKSEIPCSALTKMSGMWGCSTDYLLGLTDRRSNIN